MQFADQMDPYLILNRYFGYQDFREGQKEIIDCLLAGRDTMAVMPTGSGKSLCYQVPAMLLPGITIVISPLISLMQDQVRALNAAGIHAAFINSLLSEAQIKKALQLAAAGQYKIIYAAPERLSSRDFLDFAASSDISMVAVDEAHCISQWGQDFRPSYLNIVDFVRLLSKRPVISAFTATATRQVEEDICCILGLQDPFLQHTGFDRPNLYFRVEQPAGKEDWLLSYVKEHAGESGIIYCATRKTTEEVCQRLREEGMSAVRYHAGLPAEERKQNQDEFVYDRVPIITATNAFGMGIDKSNVRFVIHYNMPQCMENYYQEAGRAGRDGERADCILLYSPQDPVIQRLLLEQKEIAAEDEESRELIRERDRKRLYQMEDYCKSTDCLRNQILTYFGEHRSEDCGHCGNCDQEFESRDMTLQAKWVINAVYEAKGRYGANLIAGILLGGETARLKEIRADQYRSFGQLKEENDAVIKQLIDRMIAQQYLVLTEDRYRMLKIGPCMDRLKDPETRIVISIRQRQLPEKKKIKKTLSAVELTSAGFRLLSELKAVRLKLAREENLPPYIIFNDKTLIDMCVKLPETEKDFLAVSGVGESKCTKYAAAFLETLSQYQKQHPGESFALLSNKETAADSEKEEAREENSAKKGKSGRKKEAFYLTEEQAAGYEYRPLLYISEIRDALGRLRDEASVKLPVLKDMMQVLTDRGYLENRETETGLKRMVTDAGQAMGIQTQTREREDGVQYQVILYPEAIQRMLLEYFIR